MLSKHVIIRGTTPPRQQHSFHNLNTSRPVKPISQEDLIELISKAPWSEGSFITLVQTDSLRDLFVIHAVVNIETYAEKLCYDTYRASPKPYKLLQLAPPKSNIRPWCRWSDMDGARFLSEDEYNHFIVPNRDFISSYIEQYKNLETTY